MELDAPFAVPAILERADPADAFVSNTCAALEQLPQGACVGTSSLRRQAQLRALRPDLRLLDLRGNVNTRLAKLDNGEYDAIVLACAGLQRLGLDARIAARLTPPAWLPRSGAGCGGGGMPCRRGGGDGAVRRAGPCLYSLLRGGRAGDEPGSAWQLPCASSGPCRMGRRQPAPCAAWSAMPVTAARCVARQWRLRPKPKHWAARWRRNCWPLAQGNSWGVDASVRCSHRSGSSSDTAKTHIPLMGNEKEWGYLGPGPTLRIGFQIVHAARVVGVCASTALRHLTARDHAPAFDDLDACAREQCGIRHCRIDQSNHRR